MVQFPAIPVTRLILFETFWKLRWSSKWSEYWFQCCHIDIRGPRSDVDGNLQVDSRLELRVIRFSRSESDHSELVFLLKPNLLEVQAVWRAEPQVWKDKHEGKVWSSESCMVHLRGIYMHFHAFICSCLLNISCESCWVWYETPWLAVSSYVGNWGLRSGDDWELGSWQPYNPELPDSIWNVPPGTDVSGLPLLGFKPLFE